ncbi:hypothetical protein IVB14_05220 [Bradyrhizobium sp. 180]|uniref:hypothetical protein n=1 Tax=unclassified Bradyrhizobium TaxID=2631580 RepID=UPI001FF776C2|nr:MULTISPECIES: hypothetical protein [unclassified Bradyrhizobium]MCK1420727.1 hypothetical protein [Bradyrhizobium sp. CW12]MCK1489838.1 hypothetical protein [Bradyrhizobium sp. 180]MCK1532378.1 hypothetical protein [Bradyrhizobium sp. 182]MCK1595658.1 hypothetical protein [Bradyrhizobium sp. 164]MCK1647324.1 hypothetical protein [Bradyrhizobium sp. 154]
MAYVYDLDSELSDVFVDNLGTSVVEFALGYDLEQEEVILFSVTLGPSIDGVSDLRFGIRRRHIEKEWKVTGLDFSRESVLECVPSYAREEVRILLSASVSMLARACTDEKITMETYYRNLPAAALEKYEMITNVLIDNGFLVETKFQDLEGVNYWLYRRG